MKFVVTRTSNTTPYVKTFDTIQDIINFSKAMNQELIIKPNFWYNEPIPSCAKYCDISETLASEIVTIKNEIEIYDDYRE